MKIGEIRKLTDKFDISSTYPRYEVICLTPLGRWTIKYPSLGMFDENNQFVSDHKMMEFRDWLCELYGVPEGEK